MDPARSSQVTTQLPNDQPSGAAASMKLIGALLLALASAVAAGDYPPPPGPYHSEPAEQALPQLSDPERPQAAASTAQVSGKTATPSSRMLPLPDLQPGAGTRGYDATTLFGAPTPGRPIAPTASGPQPDAAGDPQPSSAGDLATPFERASPSASLTTPGYPMQPTHPGPQAYPGGAPAYPQYPRYPAERAPGPDRTYGAYPGGFAPTPPQAGYRDLVYPGGAQAQGYHPSTDTPTGGPAGGQFRDADGSAAGYLPQSPWAPASAMSPGPDATAIDAAGGSVFRPADMSPGN